MIRLTRLLAGITLSVVMLSATYTFASPAAKKYQVTGKVIELTDTMIVVQTVKGDERWEIQRSADAKVDGDLKVGAKVTIEYQMVAKNVEVKTDK